MIKRLYQCDPLPWSILFMILMTSIFIGFLFKGSVGDCTLVSEDSASLFFNSGALKHTLIGALILLIPFYFRQRIGLTGILDFNERVSLYPIGLFILTVLPSCNNLYFILAAGIILTIFARLINIKEGEASSSAAFTGGILISIAALISPYFLVLSIFLWIALASMSALKWRGVVWSLLGMLSPIYLYFAISYILTGVLPELTMSGLLQEDPRRLTAGLRIWWILYLVIFVTLFILLTLFSVRAAGKGIVIRRKVIRLGIILLVVTAAISALIFQLTGASPYLSVMSVPLGVIFMEMYRNGRNLLFDLLFISWLVLSAIISWI